MLFHFPSRGDGLQGDVLGCFCKGACHEAGFYGYPLCFNKWRRSLGHLVWLRTSVGLPSHPWSSGTPSTHCTCDWWSSSSSHLISQTGSISVACSAGAGCQWRGPSDSRRDGGGFLWNWWMLTKSRFCLSRGSAGPGTLPLPLPQRGMVCTCCSAPRPCSRDRAYKEDVKRNMLIKVGVWDGWNKDKGFYSLLLCLLCTCFHTFFSPACPLISFLPNE